MTSGGYRRPSQPAPVSGPSAMSKRTDGGPAQKLRELPDAQYGEAATFRELQQTSPLAQTPSPQQASPARTARAASGTMTPFGAPSRKPGEPVTAPPSDFVMNQGATPPELDRMRRYLPALIEAASRPDANPDFVNYVRTLRSKIY